MEENAAHNAVPPSAREEIRRALESLREDVAPGASPPVEVFAPRDDAHGEYATNLPFRLANPLRRAPGEIAEELARAWKMEGVRAEATRGGFLNFRLTPKRLGEEVARAAELGGRYVSSSIGAGRRVLVEYVSANPTGPLHVGHGRGAVLGDGIARVLARAGFDVEREYYVNDMGGQIERLGATLSAKAAAYLGGGAEVPPDGYRGEEIEAAARALAQVEGRAFLDLPESERRRRAAAFGVEHFLASNRADLEALGIGFDRFVRESTLHAEGRVAAVVERLRAAGLLYEADEPEGGEDRVRRADSKAAAMRHRQEGGTWFRSRRFGDDEDRIVLRADGTATYYTADVAYHLHKFERGYDLLVDVWGHDHAAHARRLRAALTALGCDVGRLEIALVQIVRLFSGGEEVRMSKRTGDVVTLAELVEDVGADAVRFFYLLQAPNSHFDFDLDLARKAAKENPVYYAQYAHARLCSILAKGRAKRLVARREFAERIGGEEEARPVAARILRVRDALEDAALTRSPAVLAQAALSLAAAWHRYQTEGKEDPARRVLRTDDPETASARLLLVEATRAALAAALETLGVGRPETM